MFSWKDFERFVKKARGKEVGGPINDIEFDQTILDFISSGSEFVKNGLLTIWNAKKIGIHNSIYEGVLTLLNNFEFVSNELASKAATEFADKEIDKIESLLMEVFD